VEAIGVRGDFYTREEFMHLRAQLYSQIGAILVAGLMTSTAAAETQTVRFLHNETDPPSIEFYNKAIEEFEAANPDIKVEMEAVSTDGRLQKVLAAINTKTMPEIFKILPEERFEFARKGYIVPVTTTCPARWFGWRGRTTIFPIPSAITAFSGSATI
jgi:maltose-binding protein MalE